MAGRLRVLCHHHRKTSMYTQVVEDARNPYSVEVGQVWTCRSWKYKGRCLRVLEIVLDADDPYATCEMISDSKPAYASQVGRKSRVRLRMFNTSQKGYRRIA